MLVSTIILFLTTLLLGKIQCQGQDPKPTYPDFGCSDKMKHSKRMLAEYIACEDSKKYFPQYDPDQEEYSMPLRRYKGEYCEKACILDQLGVMFTTDQKYENKMKLRGEYDKLPLQHVFTTKKMVYREFGHLTGAYECYNKEAMKKLNDPKITAYCDRFDKAVEPMLACNSTMIQDASKNKENCLEYKTSFTCLEKALKASKLCDMIENPKAMEKHIEEAIEKNKKDLDEDILDWSHSRRHF